MRWNQASVEYRGLKVVLATGGKFKCLVTVGREKNPEDVKIAAEFTKEEAEEMRLHQMQAKANSSGYRAYRTGGVLW